MLKLENSACRQIATFARSTRAPSNHPRPQKPLWCFPDLPKSISTPTLMHMSEPSKPHTHSHTIPSSYIIILPSKWDVRDACGAWGRGLDYTCKTGHIENFSRRKGHCPWNIRDYNVCREFGDSLSRSVSDIIALSCTKEWLRERIDKVNVEH